MIKKTYFLGTKLKELRESVGDNISQLVRRLNKYGIDINRQTYKYYENGINVPGGLYLYAIVDFYRQVYGKEISVDDLFRIEYEGGDGK